VQFFWATLYSKLHDTITGHHEIYRSSKGSLKGFDLNLFKWATRHGKSLYSALLSAFVRTCTLFCQLILYIELMGFWITGSFWHALLLSLMVTDSQWYIIQVSSPVTMYLKFHSNCISFKFSHSDQSAQALNTTIFQYNMLSSTKDSFRHRRRWLYFKSALTKLARLASSLSFSCLSASAEGSSMSKILSMHDGEFC